MKAFMTSAELAEECLPGLPTSSFRIREKAKREEWPSQERRGFGGGLEYNIAYLPQSALSELAFREVQKQAAKEEEQRRRIDDLDNETVAAARAQILNLFEVFIAGSGLAVTLGGKAFATRFNEKSLSIDSWIYDAVPSVSGRTLRRWRAISEAEGTQGLKDKPRGPQNSSRFDQDDNLRAYIVAQIAGRPHVSATHIYAGIEANFEDPPSLRSLQIYVKKYREEHAGALQYAADPDQWKSQRRTAFGSRSDDVIRLNQLWEIDGTIADVQCETSDGRRKRYSLVGIIDVYSRRPRVLVTEQPSAIATAAILRRAILDWGLPETLKADNGKDYTAAHVGRIARDLGFNINYCTPFSPEEKPHIERFFGTLSRELFELLPSYTGHNVAERQSIRARKSMAQRFGASKTYGFSLSPGELQLVINDWIKNSYERREHSGIKTAPYQRAAGQPVRGVPDERALDLLLAPPVSGDGVRRVQKKGVSVYGRYFIAPELGGLVGEYVNVRLDPEDEARIIIYSTDQQDFICVAEDPTLTGADRKAIAERARHVQSAKLREIKHQQKAAMDAHNPDRLASDILGYAAQNASKVTPFRAPYEASSLPSLERAREAAEAIDNAPSGPEPLPENIEREAADEIKQMEADTAARLAPQLTVHHPDPTQRPDFAPGLQGDLDFFKWARMMRELGAIEPDDLAELQDMESNHSTMLLMLSHRLVSKNELRKKGMYK